MRQLTAGGRGNSVTGSGRSPKKFEPPATRLKREAQNLRALGALAVMDDHLANSHPDGKPATAPATKRQPPIRVPCPSCDSADHRCLDSRPTYHHMVGFVTRRRRKCRTCSHRWTTYEVEARKLEDALRLSNAVRRALDAEGLRE